MHHRDYMALDNFLRDGNPTEPPPIVALHPNDSREPGRSSVLVLWWADGADDYTGYHYRLAWFHYIPAAVQQRDSSRKIKPLDHYTAAFNMWPSAKVRLFGESTEAMRMFYRFMLNGVEA